MQRFVQDDRSFSSFSFRPAANTNCRKDKWKQKEIPQICQQAVADLFILLSFRNDWSVKLKKYKNHRKKRRANESCDRQWEAEIRQGYSRA